MLLGKAFAAFVEKSPISVMVTATLERVFEPTVLDAISQDQAVSGYTKEPLFFSRCLQILSAVVFREYPSVRAYYQDHRGEIRVTRQAVYNKRERIEPPVSAALLGFCTACVAYNAVSAVKAAIRVAQGRKYVEEELSMYYLTLEVAQTTPGMPVAIPAEEWGSFRRMSCRQFAATLVELARRLDRGKYLKHKRGPKRSRPKSSVARPSIMSPQRESSPCENR